MSRQALRLIGASVMACLALGAFAGSAQAGFTWIVEGKFLKEGEFHKVSCNRAKVVGGEEEPFELIGTVGTTPVVIEFGEVKCIENVVFNEKEVAYSTGKFEFSEPKMIEPTGCTVKKFTTEPLKGQVKHFAALKSEEAIIYSPSMAGGNVAVLSIEGACAAAGNRVMKGSMVASIVPGIFKNGEIPEWLFDSEVESITGTALKFAGNVAHLEGALEFFW